MFLLRPLLIVILVASLCTLCTASTTAFIDRTITTGDDGIITVHLSLPEGMIGGIIELIPAGFEYLGTSHADDQTQQQGQRIRFAIIGENTVTYSLRGEGTPRITGSVLDLTTGEEEEIIPGQKSPAPAVILAGAITLAVLIFRRRYS